MNSELEKIYKQIKEVGHPTSFLKKGHSSHVLVRGDCGKVMSSIPSESVDLIITDPPYNKNLDYGKEFNDSKPWLEYYQWLKECLSDIPRILSPQGSLYLISYPEINARLLPFLEEELHLKFRRWLTWHYPSNIGHWKNNFTRSQRSILFFTKTDKYIFNRDSLKQPYKNPEAPVIKKRLAAGYTGRTSYDFLEPQDLDVLKINLLKNNSKERYRNIKSKFHPVSSLNELKEIDHPCQLPISLLEVFIAVGSNLQSIVLDPFAGTFTTSVAADRHNRNSLGIEINPKFINFGKERLSTI